MRNNNLQLLSGRVKKTPSTSADSNRYTFLDLKNAEPDAGVPASHTSSRGIFASDTSGTRYWLYADAGLSVDTGTGFITVNENTVFIDTTGFANSSSNNLADVLSDLDQNLFSLAEQTLESVATDDTVDGNGTAGNPLSIGQGVRYSNSPTFTGLAINASYMITGVALNDPILITTQSSHNMTDGDIVFIRDVNGTTELNGNSYYVDVQSANTFDLYSDQALTTSVDGTTGFTAYVNGGFAMGNGYTFPSLDGSDGLYLKTNGFGVLEFDRPITYGGSQPTDPDIGDLWYDQVTTGDLLIWDGGNWASTTGGGSQGAFTLVQFQGDGNTTAFDTSNPSVNKVLVFLNGILMRLTADFTYSAGVVTFTQAPLNGDTIEVLLTGNASFVGLDLLGIVNHDLITVDGSGNVTFAGNLDMGGYAITNMANPTNAQDAATKFYVDNAVGGASLTTAGDTGTGTINLNNQTLTISGTANEITTSASGQSIIVGLPNSITVDVTGALTGNASTTTALQTARDFSLTGAVTASAVSFNGTGNVALSTSIANLPNSSLANSSITITDGVTPQTVNLGDTITFADGTDINVVMSATNTLTVNHNVTGANTTITAAANTFVDQITVTAQGHVTSIATSAVDFNVADNYAFKSFTDGINTAVADSNTDTFTFSKTDQIEVSINATTDTLTIGHADSGVAANTYGGSTAIPVITIDAQGHITNASTSSISTTWTISDGTTTQQIAGGDTLTVVDGTDINAVVSATDQLTINNTSTLQTVTGRGATTTNAVGIGTNSITSGFTFDVNGTSFLRDALTVRDTAFSTAYNSVTGVVVDSSHIDGSAAGYGNSISFTGRNTTLGKKAAIALYQQGTDNDDVNLRFFVSNSSTFVDPVTLALELQRGGQVKISDAYTLPTADGTVNQVLITNGGGALSFATIDTTIDWNVANNYAFKTISVVDSTAGFSFTATGNAVADSNTDTLTLVSGTGINLNVDTTNDAVVVHHGDTSSVADLTAAGNTFVNALTFDTHGHVLTRTTAAVDFDVSTNYAYKFMTDGTNTAGAASNVDTFTFTNGTDTTAVVNAAADSITFNNTSTLDSVTGRGNTTTNSITVGDATVNGNLTVTGSTTTLNTTNLVVEDPVIVLAKNQTTPANDIGFIFQRYSSATSSNYNVAIVWNETSDRLVFGETTETGADNAISTSSEWMTVTEAGRVGIGTTNPAYMLDVFEDAAFENGKLIINEVTGADAYTEIRKTNTGSNLAIISPESVYILLDSNNDQTTRGFVIKKDTTAPGSGTTLFYVEENGNVVAPFGNVGFGTNNPQTKLHLYANNDGGVANNTLRFEDADAGTAVNQQLGLIEFYSNDTSVGSSGQKAYIGAFAETLTPQAYLAFATDGTTGTATERLRITSTGNVGIGTSSPATALDVAGTVTATAFAGPLTGEVTGNASTATTLQTARAIQVSGAVTGTANFDGSAAINIVTTATSDPTITLAGDLSGSVTLTNLTSGTLTATVGTLNQSTTGNAATATTLQTARTIGGVSFDGSANINLPGVNTTGNQNTTGSAATLTTARAIQVSGAVTGTANFDGSSAINIVTTATSDPTLTLAGDATGSATFTNLGNATLTVAVANDSHNHSSSSGNFTVGGDLTVSGGQVTNVGVSTRDKYRVWSDGTYTIGMQNNITFGAINNNYAMTFQMSNTDSRGFWWGDSTHTTAQGAMSLSTNGKLSVAHSIRLGYGETDTTVPGASYVLDVNGAFAATTKSFVIDHPTKEGMKLRHGSLEGPENGVYVRGRLKDNNTIELPDYWTGLVDEESITVTLTPIGKHQKLFVEDIADNKVVVGNDNILTKSINCFYVVWAERKDVAPFDVEYGV